MRPRKLTAAQPHHSKSAEGGLQKGTIFDVVYRANGTKVNRDRIGVLPY